MYKRLSSVAHLGKHRRREAPLKGQLVQKVERVDATWQVSHGAIRAARGQPLPGVPGDAIDLGPKPSPRQLW